ncbi:hypothetical protein [Flavobacterium chilense]|uniref:Uncharacterized protein n=1 Tax=Flavobacterium chilense TaxID=946677 RepID=A0A1M7DQY1_9FLAO|nr:hypothetical protein [Flavobacterium chilense]SHL81559.1 hypothetical protein SAMN05444484_102672 [Flavobacterium chilense]
MGKIIRIENILIHNENMILTATKTRIKLFGKAIISYQKQSNLNTLQLCK